MKVLFIARRFPPSVGGMERFAFDLSNALSEKVELKKITWGGTSKWLPLVFVGFIFRALWYLATDKSIKVIHMQDAVQAPIGWLLSKLTGRPYIVVAHGLDVTFHKGFYQQLILPFVRRANLVISISSATEDEVLKRGVSKERSIVITLGTSDDYGTPHPDRSALEKHTNTVLAGRFLLLTMGRLVKRKGVAWFIVNVLPSLVQKDENTLYLVAGAGTEKDAIEAAIKKSGLKNNVMLLGKVSDDVRSLLYQSVDVFVMPNIIVPGDMEGFGIVAHEAATAATPVVASNLEGIADAVTDKKNGLLIEPADAGGYIQKILELMNMTKKQREDLGQEFRSFTLKAYSWSAIAEKYKNAYDHLLKDN